MHVNANLYVYVFVYVNVNVNAYMLTCKYACMSIVEICIYIYMHDYICTCYICLNNMYICL